jgi:uncharacterized membrane protein YhaH (DUF805 family)
MHWILACLKNYAAFAGRASRAEFWSFALFFVVITQLAGWIDGMNPQRVTIALRMGIFELCVTLLFILPMIAAGVRRLHDSNRSGWMILLMYVPYLGWLTSQGNPSAELVSLGAFLIGFIGLVFQLALPGNTIENRFGPPPFRLSS